MDKVCRFSVEEWIADWLNISAKQEWLPLVVEFNKLNNAYREPHRSYHTQKHIEECFRQFELLRAYSKFSTEIRFAIWFHDVVYDTHRNDSEARSASWAAAVMEKQNVSAEIISRVENLILATKDHSGSHDSDVGIFMDVDLSILGAAPESFERYENEIRMEYSWVSRSEYRSKRLAIMKSFLARERIFCTEEFYKRYESRARKNILNLIGKL